MDRISGAGLLAGNDGFRVGVSFFSHPQRYAGSKAVMAGQEACSTVEYHGGESYPVFREPGGYQGRPLHFEFTWEYLDSIVR